MPRYVVERIWDDLDNEAMQNAGRRSNTVTAERFPDITWEHSHVVVDESGALRTYCIYAASNPDMIREHAALLGEHKITRILEIGSDLTPHT